MKKCKLPFAILCALLSGGAATAGADSLPDEHRLLQILDEDGQDELHRRPVRPPRALPAAQDPRVAEEQALRRREARSLFDLYRLARLADPRLQAAEARYRATLQARPKARARLLPQLAAVAGVFQVQTRYDGASSLFRDDDYRSTRYALDLRQSLVNAAHWRRLAQADSEIARAEAELQDHRQALLLRVAEAYFATLAAQDGLQYTLAEREAVAQQKRQAQRRYRAGLATLTDVREAEAQYDLVDARVIDARNRVRLARANLQLITGQLPRVLARLRDDMPLARPDPMNVDQWIRTATENNLRLRALRFASRRARQERGVQRAGHLPTLDLRAEYSVEDNDGGFREGRRSDGRVGLELNLPLLAGGEVVAGEREADALYAAARADLHAAQREVVRDTRSAYLDVLSGIARIRSLRSALRSTRDAALAADKGFRAGTRTSVDVLNALREAYRARRDYARARYDYLLATLRLKRAAGTLSERDLLAIDQWLTRTGARAEYRPARTVQGLLRDLRLGAR